MSPLSELTQLRDLLLGFNGIRDFSWMESLTNLTDVEFYGNDAAYTNVAGLENSKQLHSLTLPMRKAGTGLYEINDLAELTSLTYLNIPGGIEDLSPLGGLTKLQTLMIDVNLDSSEGDTSLEPLRGLTELSQLSLTMWGEELSVDLSPLAPLTKLQNLILKIENNGSQAAPPSVMNLSALEGMDALRSITLYVNNVTDISPLGKVKNLQSLYISNPGVHQITDWSPVDHVPNVTKG